MSQPLRLAAATLALGIAGFGSAPAAQAPRVQSQVARGTDLIQMMAALPDSAAADEAGAR
jgi:hypothetical protein